MITVTTNSSAVSRIEYRKGSLTVQFKGNSTVYIYTVNETYREVVEHMLYNSKNISIGRLINFLIKHPSVNLTAKYSQPQTTVTILEPEYITDPHGSSYDDPHWH